MPAQLSAGQRTVALARSSECTAKAVSRHQLFPPFYLTVSSCRVWKETDETPDRGRTYSNTPGGNDKAMNSGDEESRKRFYRCLESKLEDLGSLYIYIFQNICIYFANTKRDEA